MNPVQIRVLIAAALVAVAITPSGAVRARGSHDEATPRAGVAPASPRLLAESETFELVGVLENGTTLRLWLDRWANNAPVPDARIELEIGSTKIIASPTKNAVGYVATLPASLPKGVHPVTVAIAAGTESDLLVGELDVHGAAPAGIGGDSANALGLPLLFDVSRPLLATVVAAIVAAIGITFFVRARRSLG